ncbi:MAG: GH92 family glycosyl hydrolase [Alistipes sp.]
MIFLLLSVVAVLSTAIAGNKNYLQYVDPYIGSGGHGHVFVGASVPFGMVQVGPQNIFKGWDWCSGYHYSDNVLIGFSHTHLSGTGCTDLGDIQVMPFTGEVRTRRGDQDNISNSCSAYYRHENEQVSPYRYVLTLDNGIRAELTASRRVAFHKYTFPADQTPHLLINLREGNGFQSAATSIRLVDDHTLVGHRVVKGWAPEHRVYFALKSDASIADLLVFNDDEAAGHSELEGEGVKGVVCFRETIKQLAIKIAISSVSTDNALENLQHEVPHWNFDKVISAARAAWEEELERVEITTDDVAAKRIFYTAMYHTMIAPTTYCDVNGEFRGHDNKIRKADGINYSTFSCWDTYRALHPWFTIIQSDRVGDMVNSMLSICDQQGKLPIWPLIGGETNQMPGYGGVPIVSDAVVKGIRGINAERALQCAVQSATLREQIGIDYLLDQAYIPADKVFEATSIAMEYAVGDWGIAAMAHKLGHEDLERTFTQRAHYWRHYFDPNIRFIRPKFADGKFLTPYDPFQSIHGGIGYFAEGTGWQYTFMVPQDPYGLIEAIGGDQPFRAKMDSLFCVSGDMGPQASADISGLIGQYAHGNEPSHHIIYLYNYVGQQWKTAEKVRYVQKHFYTDQRDGIIGNEDCGQMSAWHILSALGFYQVNPSSGVYSFGSPLFDKAVLNLPNGRRFTILTTCNSKKNGYIRSVKLNGKNYSNSYIVHDDIVRGGTLEFEMGATPNYDFGSAPEHRPLRSCF